MQEDFTHFLNAIKDMAEMLNFDHYPEFVMQDHCRASFNAIRAVYPNTVVLMCNFHVVLNLRKHKKLILNDDKHGTKYQAFKHDVDAF